MVRVPVVAACLCALTLGAPALCGEPAVQAPVFAVGDSWVFDETTEKGQTGFAQTRLDEIVERLDAPTMVVGLKRDGAPTGYQDRLVGQDWSQRHMVDGDQATTVRPFNFPMHPGKSWSTDFIDSIRRGNQLSDHVRRTYRVVGWEDVTVPAGTFHALKVEAKGVDEGMIEVPNVAVGGAATSNQGGTTFTQTHRGGRGKLVRATYSALYYVPALRNYAKSIEEQYDQEGVRVIRSSSELVSYKLGS